MRWLILTDDHPPLAGGIASFVERVALALVGRGDEVTVVSRGGRVAISGTRLVTARGPSFGRFSGRWLALAAARELLRADHVLATTWVAATAASRVRPDVIVTAHGSDVTRPPVRAESTLRATLRRAGRVLALSRYLAGCLAQRGVRAEVAPAPVAVDPRRPPRRPFRGRWGFVGRLTPHKGVDRFVRWVAQARVEGVVLGDGPALAGLRALAAGLGADVRFLGPRPASGVNALWPELDLVVLAPRPHDDGSGAEGLGLVLLEAAGRGVPVVGCHTGGVPEAVGPGLLVGWPDDTARAVAAIEDWWTPARGREAWAWVRAHHGTHRTLSALDGACP